MTAITVEVPRRGGESHVCLQAINCGRHDRSVQARLVDPGRQRIVLVPSIARGVENQEYGLQIDRGSARVHTREMNLLVSLPHQIERCIRLQPDAGE